jgi:hypothetical protein
MTLQRPGRLRLLRQGGEASTMTRSEVSTRWNGAILPLSTLGAGRKSSITQLSLFFPWSSVGNLSRPRGKTERQVYVCLRQMSGGQKKYEKKNPGWHCKIDSKKTGCHCRVAIKLYPHTDTILGNYTNTHDHEIGSNNIAYMRISGIARE